MNLAEEFHPVEKPHHKRRTTRRASKTKFSDTTMKRIFERDGGACVRCGTMRDLESVPHHIIYRSHGGPGTVDNGVMVCRTCHTLAHQKKEVRKWFEQYREERLMNNASTR